MIYTVILKLPDYLTQDQTEVDYPCSTVFDPRNTPQTAAKAAKNALAKKYDLEPADADDFLTIAVFEGEYTRQYCEG